MNIPLVDLKRQYLSIKDEIDGAIRTQIEKTEFIGGQAVRTFEEKFAAYVGTEHCIGCANGTDSIELLLQAMDIGKGDEVLVPAHTWISTSEAVTSVGATPVFVDCGEDNYTIDIAKAKLTPNTKAIIAVHLYGLPAEMTAIMDLAQANGLRVIEDCAQAHGAEYKGQTVGTFGDGASFSFYPGKNLGAYGDAGAVVTNNKEIADRVRAAANHGQLKKHEHFMEGRNSRLDSLQAAILNVKLNYIEGWTNKRIENAARYDELLADVGVKTPKKPEYSKHVYHIYAIQLEKPNRAEVMAHLSENGIGVAIHYPKALPFLIPYKDRISPENFTGVSNYQDKLISLPMFPELTQEEIGFIVDRLKEVV